MMANRNCVLRDRENGSTDLGYRELIKDFMRVCEQFEAEKESRPRGCTL